MTTASAAYSPSNVVDGEGRLGELDRGHVARDEARAEALGLAADEVDELGTEDALREAGEVLDLAGEQQLAAGAEALDAQGLQAGAGGVESGGVAGGAAADDDQVLGRHVIPCEVGGRQALRHASSTANRRSGVVPTCPLGA